MQWFGALMYISLARLYKEGETSFDPKVIMKTAEALKALYPMP